MIFFWSRTLLLQSFLISLLLRLAVFSLVSARLGSLLYIDQRPGWCLPRLCLRGSVVPLSLIDDSNASTLL